MKSASNSQSPSVIIKSYLSEDTNKRTFHIISCVLLADWNISPLISVLHLRLSVDNTANILTRRGGFSRREMSMYFLPVVISDNDYPIQSSTSTLIVRVCACDSRGNMQTCNPEVLPFSDGLTTGALVAILLCVIILLSKFPYVLYVQVYEHAWPWLFELVMFVPFDTGVNWTIPEQWLSNPSFTTVTWHSRSVQLCAWWCIKGDVFSIFPGLYF